MTGTATHCRHARRRSLRPEHVVLILATLAAWAAAIDLSHALPVAQWAALFAHRNVGDMRVLTVQFLFLPRCAVSLIAGAALGLAGAVLQHVLRNPLADPTTLGVSAGASLSLVIVSLWFPSLLVYGRDWVAMIGGLAGLGIVISIAWRHAFSSISLILGGLLATLSAGAATSVLMLFFGDNLVSVFLWQSGSLYQNGWANAAHLFSECAAGMLFVTWIYRPLAVLELGDESARSVGSSPRLIRTLALTIASALAAAVVSSVGIIGFVGLTGPWLARLSGARTLRQRLIWASLISAGLLWLADNCVQLWSTPGNELPTGSVTALIGAPLLLFLMRSVREVGPLSTAPTPTPRISRRHTQVWGVAGAGALLALIVVAASFNRTLGAWDWETWSHVRFMIPLRGPRIGGAAAAGGLLGLAGVLMQRMTRNPMASPEILGISSGASLGLIVLMFVMPVAAQGLQIAAASFGAAIATVMVFAATLRATLSPGRLVLTGVIMTTLLGSIVSLLMASGDPRMSFLAAWMSGSTYAVQRPTALLALGLLAVCASMIPFIARPMDILFMGEPAACSLGVHVRRDRTLMLLLCASATGAATVIVGPISFIGLMAPHLARMAGFRRGISQTLCAATLGAALLVLADWAGRNLLYPNQVPAGLLAIFVGGPYFLVLLWRQK
ncbi:Fe(3+)-hydroxamate ABC transporter permease FhuB [Pararobbsia silviterrae]|uniref:Fe(3+)-hydroxamate ABC transporter permease FhuB n=1 Tax=Pararobbsia silviterrae TaxID=1792498 RepID=A0A494XGI5_9BURK|nr:Fe(3+)-hydroxamate ABC transporter permease FhuB [Pararobbsia silviterrae]RKP47676.1 Fe(3+)-hydroxamate ABC transporter permease FhuB [Pararobbsia silviterrae]